MSPAPLAMRGAVPLLLGAAWGLCLLAGCSREPGGPAPGQAQPAQARTRKAARGPAPGARESNAGHEHEEISDLDRPLAELFAQRCEHRKPTFECDTCRYEIGVVKAPQRLFAEGLLEVTRPARERVSVPLRLNGEVRFDERRVTHVSSPAQGLIRTVSVALGDRAQRGQALVVVESVVVGDAEGAYLEAQASLRLAQRNFERLVELRREAISSEKEYLQAKQEHEAAQIRAEAALGRLTRLGVAEAEARRLGRASARGRLVLRAPATGTVLAMHAVPGEVAKGEESLVTIGDNSTVWVWADLYERDIAQVLRARAGNQLRASVEVSAYPDEAFPGTVDSVSLAMEPASRTAKLRVQVPNSDGKLLAGMFAAVKVLLPSAEETLTLPRSAVLEDEGREFVFVRHRGDYFVRRPVSRGRSWADRVEVKRGLAGRETVVADGAFLLKSDVLRSKMGAGCAD